MYPQIAAGLTVLITSRKMSIELILIQFFLNIARWDFDYYVALLPRRGPHCVALCLSVCLSIRLSVRPVIVAIGNVSFRQPLASRMYFSARTEGRISYSHLGRTDSCFGSNKYLYYILSIK